MHFGLTLELPDIDMWNIDSLDTHLDFLDTNISSKYFVILHNVFKTSSRHVLKTSSALLRWRRFEGVFKTCLKDVFKMSWRPSNVCWVQSKHKKLFLTSKNEEPITTLSEEGTSLITVDSALSGLREYKMSRRKGSSIKHVRKMCISGC